MYLVASPFILFLEYFTDRNIKHKFCHYICHRAVTWWRPVCPPARLDARDDTATGLLHHDGRLDAWDTTQDRRTSGGQEIQGGGQWTDANTGQMGTKHMGTEHTGNWTYGDWGRLMDSAQYIDHTRSLVRKPRAECWCKTVFIYVTDTLSWRIAAGYQFWRWKPTYLQSERL